jgi:hypothetical protein
MWPNFYTAVGSLISVEKSAALLFVSYTLAIIRLIEIGPPIRFLQLHKPLPAI